MADKQRSTRLKQPKDTKSLPLVPSKRKYSTTRAECLAKISGVCDRCGGVLAPFRTQDNAGNPTYWSVCNNCKVFCWGIKQEIFDIATELVTKHDYVPYSWVEKDNKEYWLNTQRGGAASMASYIYHKVKEARKDELLRACIVWEKYPDLLATYMIERRESIDKGNDLVFLNGKFVYECIKCGKRKSFKYAPVNYLGDKP